jgi:SH3 domain-containing YSC84-like protein 1
MRMKKVVVFVLFLVVCLATAVAETEANRVESAANVLNEIMSTPDKGIPEEILGSAKCVAVVPSMLKGGLGFGGAYGRGVASCRTADGWSAPAPFSVKGGSFGLQIGGQAVDLVMVIMNEQGMQNLLASKFKLGADASVAAGPVGRHAEGDTDWKMRAQVLTYSRARGAFAGITINGAVISQDKDATRELYGRLVPFKTILTGAVQTPQTGEAFISAVRKATGPAPASSSPTASTAPAPATQPAPPSTPAPSSAPPNAPSTPAGTEPVPAAPPKPPMFL